MKRFFVATLIVALATACSANVKHPAATVSPQAPVSTPSTAPSMVTGPAPSGSPSPKLTEFGERERKGCENQWTLRDAADFYTLVLTPSNPKLGEPITIQGRVPPGTYGVVIAYFGIGSGPNPSKSLGQVTVGDDGIMNFTSTLPPGDGEYHCSFVSVVDGAYSQRARPFFGR